jgi:hypothetical protein
MKKKTKGKKAKSNGCVPQKEKEEGIKKVGASKLLQPIETHGEKKFKKISKKKKENKGKEEGQKKCGSKTYFCNSLL